MFGCFNSLRPRLNRRPFADDIFKCIFLIENEWILPRISLKFVPKVPINNIPALVQIMAWRRSGDKPLSEPMMVSLLTHICVTRPQWVRASWLKGRIIRVYKLTHICYRSVVCRRKYGMMKRSKNINQQQSVFHASALQYVSFVTVMYIPVDLWRSFIFQFFR